MRPEPLGPSDPDAGHYRINCEHRFRYLVEATRAMISQFVPQVLPCLICQIDTGLQLSLDGNVLPKVVRARCPKGHQWDEPAIDPSHFETYARLQTFREPDPQMLWIIDAGFGEQAPEIDYAQQLGLAAKLVTKYALGRAKSRAKGVIRKPLRKMKRKAINTAYRPVAAALGALWDLQAGGTPQAPAPVRKKKAQPGPKVPSYAKYRKAYGMQAPKRGPRCLVCEDTGSIPGTTIRCTECPGPAASVRAAAERRAARARQPKPKPKPKAAQGRPKRRQPRAT